eukprot:gnl/TRDRNA2_/TRDRNA2_179904_c0_seq1.p1 gnl/TRDRNA2_/TRDRNA2_179904_c0~~gnl/TRDRNA2_/TRDRNA2_179904_c0_seq1.p1  ORF type:complete len:217 (-),score=29.87 gnl/TRDRNA2_/TRDRNA2_179904_c0_seq1:133-783(-)
MGCAPSTSMPFHAQADHSLHRAASTDSISLGQLRLARQTMSGSTDSCEVGAFVRSSTSMSLGEMSSFKSKSPKSLKRTHGKAPSDQIESIIESNPIVLFSNARCSRCRAAKTALGRAASMFLVVELEDFLVGDAASYQGYLAHKTGMPALPFMFIRGNSVGDHSKIVSMELDGTLAELCADAGTVEPEMKLCRQVSRRSHLKRQGSKGSNGSRGSW